MLTALLIVMLSLALNVQQVKASGTIYIRPDGRIDPLTAPITSADNVTYTFIDNINDEIVVERSNITIDGNGHTLQGTGIGYGFSLQSINNVTMKDTNIRDFKYGVYLHSTSKNVLFGNNIKMRAGGLQHGFYLYNSSNNRILENQITGGDIRSSGDFCVYLGAFSNNNTVSGNRLTKGVNGVGISGASNNTVSENEITANEWYGYGIILSPFSSYNRILGNNITNMGNGIKLYASSYNKISRNNIKTYRGFVGIGKGMYFLGHSKNNTVSDNNMINNEKGICLEEEVKLNNLIYHNNFVNNNVHVEVIGLTANVWDNSYPSGGNYWSNYTDVDLYCGPNQDIGGADGIWDHPYVIDASNKDNYPLVKPYVPGTLTVSIYTDKYTYHVGETMNLGLNVTNPDSVKYLCFAIWVTLPDGSIYLYKHIHSVVLPIGLNYANPTFQVITLPSLPPGTYTWHAAFLERATHKILVEDTAQWEFI